MKKLINDPRSAVRDLLEGLVDTDPGLAILETETVVLRADIPADPAERPVAVLSGGGSGHEPAHAGFVGDGMLTAAIAGDVFTSPSVDAVLAGILASAGPAGALLIVKNYTGDRLNFALAAELAQAEGIPVEIVVVADDVALRDRLPRDRSRGIAGTVLVHKIAGAAAQAGHPLAEVAKLARSAADAIVTMGIALGSCTVPSAGKPGFELGETEIEFGLGIHGEKGLRKAGITSVDEIVQEMVGHLVAQLEPSARPVGVLINGLGGTPPMELAIVARAALAELRARGLSPELAWTGNFMTALEMPGCSLSLIPLDDVRRGLLEAKTSVRVWPASAAMPGTRRILPAPAKEQEPQAAPGPLAPQMRRAVAAVADALEAAEARLTDLDAAGGDGDLGASMVRGAEALRALPGSAYRNPKSLLSAAADALRRAIAGSSGPFYAAALMRASNSLPDTPEPSLADWSRALEEASGTVRKIGGASPGDRTMVDALAPAAEAFAAAASGAGSECLARAARAAEAGAEATAGMTPKFGRAAYLGERAVGTPDGGAIAVAIWLRALEETLARTPAG